MPAFIKNYGEVKEVINLTDTTNVMKHLNDHQKYPASKAALVAECNNLSDFSQEDKKWFENTLPEATYASANEVAAALGM